MSTAVQESPLARQRDFEDVEAERVGWRQARDLRTM